MSTLNLSLILFSNELIPIVTFILSKIQNFVVYYIVDLTGVVKTIQDGHSVITLHKRESSIARRRASFTFEWNEKQKSPQFLRSTLVSSRELCTISTGLELRHRSLVIYRKELQQSIPRELAKLARLSFSLGNFL